MHKLPDNIKKFYLENHEGIPTQKLLGIEILEDYMNEYGMKQYSKEIVYEFEHLWDIAESFWIFPDLEDYKKIVDKVYQRYGADSASTLI